jgi:exodeoxyribonuclease III
MTFRVATWNVNSVRRRLPGLKRLVEVMSPDVICLQETKVVDPLFPALDCEALGYPYRLIHGQKGYNGVAILSRLPLKEPGTRCWQERTDCRHGFAVVDAGPGLGEVEIHSLYIPAGGELPNPERNPKFAHKLRFLDEAASWSAARGRARPAVLCGDFNVAPLEHDVWSHEKLKNVVTHTRSEIDRLDRMLAAGEWIDAIRHLVPAPEKVFTWWSYRATDWAAFNRGRRLDHIWISPELLGSLKGCAVLTDARGWEEPSDHVPVGVTLEPAEAQV